MPHEKRVSSRSEASGDGVNRIEQASRERLRCRKRGARPEATIVSLNARSRDAHFVSVCWGNRDTFVALIG